jgi:murein DD-endopeptidase MepM/ murein hydrolase activator NlpD
VVAVVLDYSKLQRVVADYERLRIENHSIRSEAAAIISRLESVQSALNRVDNFSNQIREISKPEASGRKKGQKGNTVSPTRPTATPLTSIEHPRTNPSMGIGPIPKEDYLLARSLRAQNLRTEAAVNLDRLEFRETFERLLQIGRRSETQARELERLLKDVRSYQAKIAVTPTLAPAEGYLSSLFGVRQSPMSGSNQMHWGVDIAAPIGTPVYATAAGTVVLARYADDYGNYLEIDHGNGIQTRYAHLNTILVRPGMRVTKGSIVAQVGNTGRSTGPHIHYEVEVAGRRVDPIKYIH